MPPVGGRVIAFPAQADLDAIYADLGDAGDVIIPESDYSTRERCALQALKWIEVRKDGSATCLPGRKLCIGTSTNKAAWTDGQSYIAFNCASFRRNIEDINGWTKILTTYAHEMAHDGVDREHSGEFYEAFHDIVDSIVARISEVYRSYVTSVDREGRKTSNKQRVEVTLAERTFAETDS
jgi:hypothetical protein